MNTEQQELLDRLMKDIDSISQYPKTAVEESLLLEELVAILEEIIDDLAAIPDEQVARNLRKIISKVQQ